MKLTIYDEAVSRLCDRTAEDLLSTLEQAEARAIGHSFRFDEHVFMRLRDDIVYRKVHEALEEVLTRLEEDPA